MIVKSVRQHHLTFFFNLTKVQLDKEKNIRHFAQTQATFKNYKLIFSSTSQRAVSHGGHNIFKTPTLHTHNMDEILAQFTSITSADPERSAQYLKVTDHNLEQAIQLFFENDGAALEGTGSAIAQSTSSNHLAGTTPADAIDVDDDAAASQIPAISNPDQSFGVQGRHAIENDEEMARRLQEEMYGSAAGGMGQDREGIRAPIGRTTDTLLGPDPGFAGFADDPDELQAAVRQQMLARARRGGKLWLNL